MPTGDRPRCGIIQGVEHGSSERRPVGPFTGEDLTSLQHDRLRFEALMAGSGTMVWLADSDGRLLTDLPQWREVTGMSVDELLGEGWLEAIHPDDRGRVAQAWGTAVATGETYEVAYRIVGRFGETHWMDVRGVPVDVTDGVREWIGTCHDDTGRRTLEYRLEDQRATLESVLNQSVTAVAVLWGPDHEFRYFNERYLDLVPADRVTRGMRVAEALPEVAHLLPLLDRAFAGEELRVQDQAVPFDDERSYEGFRYYDVTYAPLVRDGRPMGVTVVAQETTERVRERRSLEARIRRERVLAESFQRALLPGSVAPVAGADIAVRYLPASVDVGVGGDWYDVVELGARRLMLVVGDVCGRGLGAATTMAQVRAAVRAYAIESPAPVELLTRVRVFVEELALDLVTVAVCVVDLGDGTVRYASAGHPPPVLCGPGVAPVFLDALGASMLGLPGSEQREVVTSLEPGGAIVLYTDGLIEERGRDLGETMEELRRAATCDAAGAAAMCERVAAARLGEAAALDDTALLVFRWQPEGMDASRDDAEAVAGRR